MFQVGAEFQPFPSPPATSLQDAAGKLCCPAETSRELLTGRIFPRCFPNQLLGAASSQKAKKSLWLEKGG